MTKADIVNEITKNTGIDKVTVLTTVEAFMDAVKASLSKDENVYLRGFGSFVVKKRAQKTARNISKNTTIINFVLGVVLCLVVTNAVWVLVFRKREEMVYLHNIARDKFGMKFL